MLQTTRADHLLALVQCFPLNLVKSVKYDGVESGTLHLYHISIDWYITN